MKKLVMAVWCMAVLLAGCGDKTGQATPAAGTGGDEQGQAGVRDAFWRELKNQAALGLDEADVSKVSAADATLQLSLFDVRTDSSDPITPPATPFEWAAVRSRDSCGSRSQPGHTQPFTRAHDATAPARRRRLPGTRESARDDGDGTVCGAQYVRPTTRASHPAAPHFFGARGIYPHH